MSSAPVGPLGPVVRLAPAKLNLTLAVVGRRPDGYHLLHSVLVPLALADRISLAILPGERADRLHVTGFGAGPDRDNLVVRAIAEARAAAGGAAETPALAVRLEKRIPVAAGLGGGSSDAAAALDGALEAWGLGAGTPGDPGPAVRAEAAARLGSDVPFFLAGGTACVEGRGERVTPLPGVRGTPPGILLVTPRVLVPTADVFAVHAASGVPPNGATRLTSEHLAVELRDGLDSRRLADRAGILAAANDLLGATAILVQGLIAFRRALARLLGRPIGQSGSGPTLWVLYPSHGDAEAAARTVTSALAAGTLVGPGDGEPFVAATSITGGPPGPSVGNDTRSER